MKTIPLTKGYEALVDDADYERIVSMGSWYAHVDCRKDGSIVAIYALRKESMTRRKLWMHRIVLGIVDPHIQTDHRNRNGLDNQRHNLRICDPTGNCQNRGRSHHNTSGFKGVSYNRRWGKWDASIKVN